MFVASVQIQTGILLITSGGLRGESEIHWSCQDAIEDVKVLFPSVETCVSCLSVPLCRHQIVIFKLASIVDECG